MENPISIHPMLKLIIICERVIKSHVDFNTSHVKVNHVALPSMMLTLTNFNTSHVKVNRKHRSCKCIQHKISIHPMLKLIPTYFLHSIQYTIPDSPVFINVFKIFTSHRAICQKNLQNHRNATVFADSRNFALIGSW